MSEDTVTIPTADFLRLVEHVKHDVLCTVYDEEYVGDECCRHGQCAEAEAKDEIHGDWVLTRGRHRALTPAIREMYEAAKPAAEVS